MFAGFSRFLAALARPGGNRSRLQGARAGAADPGLPGSTRPTPGDPREASGVTRMSGTRDGRAVGRPAGSAGLRGRPVTVAGRCTGSRQAQTGPGGARTPGARIPSPAAQPAPPSRLPRSSSGPPSPAQPPRALQHGRTDGRTDGGAAALARLPRPQPMALAPPPVRAATRARC